MHILALITALSLLGLEDVKCVCFDLGRHLKAAFYSLKIFCELLNFELMKGSEVCYKE